MSTLNPGSQSRARREAIAKGLRELADWLESTPGVPLPWDDSGITYAAHDGSDEVKAAAMRLIAAAAGVPLQRTPGGHLTAARRFSGGVTYRAFAVPSEAKAEHLALMSYAGAVRPDRTEHAA